VTIRHAGAAVWRAAAVAVVVAIAALLVVRTQSQSASPPATSTQPAAWRLPSLDGGGDVRLAGFRGTPVVVDFFASWCTACRGELPGMAALSAQLKGQVTFVGVDSEESGDGLAMARQLGVGWWPLARDVGGTQASGLHDALGARGMPLTAFYDRSGRLLAVVPGAISKDDLRSRLHTMFGVSV
jgi:cytochrome c biogenesis protein CcmG, thiol:disulfide interchange protein DsbE